MSSTAPSRSKVGVSLIALCPHHPNFLSPSLWGAFSWVECRHRSQVTSQQEAFGIPWATSEELSSGGSHLSRGSATPQGAAAVATKLHRTPKVPKTSHH